MCIGKGEFVDKTDLLTINFNFDLLDKKPLIYSFIKELLPNQFPY